VKRLVLFAVLAAGAGAECPYRTGIHLENRDTVAHEILWNCSFPSTRICEAERPLPGVKRGIVRVSERSDSGGRGFTLLPPLAPSAWEHLPPPLHARIDPGKEVCCLCVAPVQVALRAGDSVKTRQGDRIRIQRGGVIRVTPRGKSRASR
jgi:hypothetical protein